MGEKKQFNTVVDSPLRNMMVIKIKDSSRVNLLCGTHKQCKTVILYIFYQDNQTSLFSSFATTGMFLTSVSELCISALDTVCKNICGSHQRFVSYVWMRDTNVAQNFFISMFFCVLGFCQFLNGKGLQY